MYASSPVLVDLSRLEGFHPFGGKEKLMVNGRSSGRLHVMLFASSSSTARYRGRASPIIDVIPEREGIVNAEGGYRAIAPLSAAVSCYV